MITVSHEPTPPIEPCLDVARALEAYFTDDARDEIRTALDGQRAIVARDGEAVVGFATVDVGVPEVHRRGDGRDGAAAELTWLGVAPEHRGSGVGRRLLSVAEGDLLESGVRVLTVKTLAPGTDYRPYVGTRRFYESVGFVPIETIDPYPGWDPGNPCSIYVKPLSRADGGADGRPRERPRSDENS